MEDEMILAESEVNEDEAEEDDEEDTLSETTQAVDVRYDASLPTQHSYLGTDMEELRGRTVLEDDCLLNLPLVTLPGVVLIPGQTLPLRLFQQSSVSMMRQIIQNDRTFGMISARYNDPNFRPVIASVGTTAEIRSFKEETNVHGGMSIIQIKAEGRQRFEVLETRRQSDGILLGKVRILPEIILGSGLDNIHLSSMHKYQMLPVPDSVCDKQQPTSSLLQSKKYDRFSSANFTWWPPWVYKLYDAQILINKIKEKLQSWNSAINVDAIPVDPTKFSFWVVSNMPMNDYLKLKILSLNSPIQRLQYELHLLNKHTVFSCKGCQQQVTDMREMFSMSLEGPQGTYVNPGGYVHETITVYKAKGLSLFGPKSTDQSWFPGYAWIVAECRNCENHMGWKFVATNSELKPEKFWGLCRSSLVCGIDMENTEIE